MKRKIVLLVILASLISVAIGTGMVQAQRGQANLAPGVWYRTTIHNVMTWENWDNPGTGSIEGDKLFSYKREADYLYVAGPSGQRTYFHSPNMEEGVYRRLWAVDEANTPWGGIQKSVATQFYEITINGDGIAWTRYYDVYKLVDAGAEGGIHWVAFQHRSDVADGPLGKPVNP